MMMITKEKLIRKPEEPRSHIVLLGAGASRAAFPNGDAAGKPLPLMKDLVGTLDLEDLLRSNNIDLAGNFETIYAHIEDVSLREEVEKHIYNYFSKLKLPNTATHYDRLLLSLREKDAIFTFNWDPFLMDAYERNEGVASLPEIFFLHGNVRIGSCKTHHDKWGKRGELCPTCNQKFVDVPLLYPIEKKNYFSGNNYTALSWENAKSKFADAFTMTIFGYSAPESDVEAVELIEKAWFRRSDREFARIQVIDILNSKRWKRFEPKDHPYHLSTKTSFEQSRLWDWPRFSCEALSHQVSQGVLCEDFPLPETDNLNKLQNAIKEIAEYE